MVSQFCAHSRCDLWSSRCGTSSQGVRPKRSWISEAGRASTTPRASSRVPTSRRRPGTRSSGRPIRLGLITCWRPSSQSLTSASPTSLVCLHRTTKRSSCSGTTRGSTTTATWTGRSLSFILTSVTSGSTATLGTRTDWPPSSGTSTISRRAARPSSRRAGSPSAALRRTAACSGGTARALRNPTWPPASTASRCPLGAAP
mmetsp:Transcript_90504/g.240377  ORF Transcript_90504/g.240377 Transcript_90504/m.240377 type:complete len:201 (+) Transcript_90504:417-1019(+)